jgi:tetratricopeptide (TPR) repeat protein
VTLKNLGIVDWYHGRLEDAASLFEQAARLCREIGHEREEVKSLSNLGALYRAQGRRQEARRTLEEVLSAQRRFEDRPSESTTLMHLAAVYLDDGAVEQAGAAYEQALTIKREIGHRAAEAWSLCALASIERRMGRLDRAARFLERSESILDEVGHALETGQIACERGHLLLARAEPAREVLEQVEQIAAAANDGAGGMLDSIVAKLRRAVDAFEAGEHDRLFRGELIEELPQGLRRRLEQDGQL